MDSEPVTLWRTQYRLNLTRFWKSEVDKTVTDIDLWKSILAKWKRERRHPGIKEILSEYESLSYERESMETIDGNGEASIVSTRGRERISKRGDSDVSEVWSDPPSIYFGAG